MAKVSMSTDLKVTGDQVWNLIGHFNALPDWHPAVEKSTLEEEGQLRRLSLVGGGTIVEKLERVDNDKRTYSYAIVDSPLPLANYRGSLTVTETDDGCAVQWSGEFDPMGAPEADATKIVSDIYQAGFDNLRKMFGG